MKLKPLIQHRTRYLFLALGSIFSLLPFAFQAPIASADSPSFVRIIHASPDIGTADVFVDGKHLLSNFQFGTVTGYVSMAPGPHVVKVGLIGRGPGAATITQTLNVNSGDVYTVAALGTQKEGFKLLAFNDNNLVQEGKAELRFYNLSPDTQLNSVSSNNSTLCGILPYQNATAYLPLQAGAYNLAINTDQKSSPIPFAAKLDQNTITSIFAVGLANGKPGLQFISSKVNAVPSLPGTGSDPNAPAPTAPQGQPLLLIGILALCALLATTVVFGRRARSRRS
ncbi:MAG: DUF4397 domain-containing protein [Chloroflexota bacterium]|nr:DUF4397 domain-containing protein [Chloroflexota bacterium]